MDPNKHFGSLKYFQNDVCKKTFFLKKGICSFGGTTTATVRINAGNPGDIFCEVFVDNKGIILLDPLFLKSHLSECELFGRDQIEFHSGEVSEVRAQDIDNKAQFTSNFPKLPILLNGKSVRGPKVLKSGDMLSIFEKNFKYENKDLPSDVIVPKTPKAGRASIMVPLRNTVPTLVESEAGTSYSSEKRKSIRIKAANSSFKESDVSLTPPSNASFTQAAKNNFVISSPTSAVKPTNLRNRVLLKSLANKTENSPITRRSSKRRSTLQETSLANIQEDDSTSLLNEETEVGKENHSSSDLISFDTPGRRLTRSQSNISDINELNTFNNSILGTPKSVGKRSIVKTPQSAIKAITLESEATTSTPDKSTNITPDTSFKSTVEELNHTPPSTLPKRNTKKSIQFDPNNSDNIHTPSPSNNVSDEELIHTPETSSQSPLTFNESITKIRKSARKLRQSQANISGEFLIKDASPVVNVETSPIASKTRITFSEDTTKGSPDIPSSRKVVKTPRLSRSAKKSRHSLVFEDIGEETSEGEVTEKNNPNKRPRRSSFDDSTRLSSKRLKRGAYSPNNKENTSLFTNYSMISEGSYLLNEESPDENSYLKTSATEPRMKRNISMRRSLPSTKLEYPPESSIHVCGDSTLETVNSSSFIYMSPSNNEDMSSFNQEIPATQELLQDEEPKIQNSLNVEESLLAEEVEQGNSERRSIRQSLRKRNLQDSNISESLNKVVSKIQDDGNEDAASHITSESSNSPGEINKIDDNILDIDTSKNEALNFNFEETNKIDDLLSIESSEQNMSLNKSKTRSMNKSLNQLEDKAPEEDLVTEENLNKNGAENVTLRSRKISPSANLSLFDSFDDSSKPSNNDLSVNETSDQSKSFEESPGFDISTKPPMDRISSLKRITRSSISTNNPSNDVLNKSTNVFSLEISPNAGDLLCNEKEPNLFDERSIIDNDISGTQDELSFEESPGFDISTKPPMDRISSLKRITRSSISTNNPSNDVLNKSTNVFSLEISPNAGDLLCNEKEPNLFDERSIIDNDISGTQDELSFEESPGFDISAKPPMDRISSLKRITRSSISTNNPSNDVLNKSTNVFSLEISPNAGDLLCNEKESNLFDERSIIDNDIFGTQDELIDNSSLYDSLKESRTQKEPLNDLSSPRGVKQLLKTPKPQKEPLNDLTSPKGVKTLFKTPKPLKEPMNDLTSPKGVKKLLKTPKPQKEPLNDLTSPKGVKKLLKTPKVQKEPLNDLTSPRGVKQLLKTPKQQKEPANDLTSPKGVKKLLKTPKVQKEPLNDLTSPKGVKQLLKTPKPQKEPLNDLTSPKGVKKLLKTPKVQKEPLNDLTSPKGVKQLLRTPKIHKNPENDLSSPRGVKQLMATPKLQKEPLNDLSSPKGMKKLLKTPKSQKEPLNDLTSPKGVKKLLKTPKIQKEPLNDLTSPKGVKQLLRTPKVHKDPENDLSSPRGVKQLMATPKLQKEPLNDLSSPKGVEDLFNTSTGNDLNISGVSVLDDMDLFPKKIQIKTYRGKSMSPIKPVQLYPNRKTFGVTANESPDVNKWKSEREVSSLKLEENTDNLEMSIKRKSKLDEETSSSKKKFKSLEPTEVNDVEEAATEKRSTRSRNQEKSSNGTEVIVTPQRLNPRDVKKETPLEKIKEPSPTPEKRSTRARNNAQTSEESVKTKSKRGKKIQTSSESNESKSEDIVAESTSLPVKRSTRGRKKVISSEKVDESASPLSITKSRRGAKKEEVNIETVVLENDDDTKETLPVPEKKTTRARGKKNSPHNAEVQETASPIPITRPRRGFKKDKVLENIEASIENTDESKETLPVPEIKLMRARGRKNVPDVSTEVQETGSPLPTTRSRRGAKKEIVVENIEAKIVESPDESKETLPMPEKKMTRTRGRKNIPDVSTEIQEAASPLSITRSRRGAIKEVLLDVIETPTSKPEPKGRVGRKRKSAEEKSSPASRTKRGRNKEDNIPVVVLTEVDAPTPPAPKSKRKVAAKGNISKAKVPANDEDENGAKRTKKPKMDEEVFEQETVKEVKFTRSRRKLLSLEDMEDETLNDSHQGKLKVKFAKGSTPRVRRK